MATHNDLGNWGEEHAVGYLLDKGYAILERNFRFQKAEVDIIAQREDTVIVMVEVKTRNSAFFGDPQGFVTPAKVQLLIKAANQYCIENQLDAEVRFDIIAILKNKEEETLTHLENAFYHF